MAGIFVSANGDIYVAENNNNKIRKISAAGILTTVAGNGTAAFSGDGGSATGAALNQPMGVFLDDSGNIFIADKNNNRIRKVASATGIITTVAGSGSYGYGGDGSLATAPCVRLADPQRVRADAAGDLFIADQTNSCIREVANVDASAVAPAITIAASSATICAGSPVNFSATIKNGGANPVYQWKKNGTKVGTNSPAFSSPALANGDSISCELTASSSCGTMTVVSNGIKITVNPVVTPTITISSDKNSICTGTAVSFTATSTNTGTNPTYQWKINGNNTGANNPAFSGNSFASGDQVTCMLTSNANCASPTSVTSNTIKITVNTVVTPTVSIAASATNICSGMSVTFTATATNSGDKPTYNWKINGISAGTNSSAFTSSNLKNGDTITCSIVTDPQFTCVTNNAATSNPVVMTVSTVPAPSVSIVASDSNICPGTAVTFTASVQNGGTSPSYQWKVNGSNTGANNPVYSGNNFVNGDSVRCIVSVNNTSCGTLTASSNKFIMMVKKNPAITIKPANPSVSYNGSIQLTATVEGTVHSYNWSPANGLVNVNSLTPQTKPLQATTIFSISVTSEEGCSSGDTVTVKVLRPIFMPSAFTPNNDGLNDIFRIPPGASLTLTDFSIFGRWGNRVFSTKDITKGWDGTSRGVPVASGSYVYIISGISEGEKVSVKGTFVLIR